VARNMYGATSADFTLTSGGRPVPGAELTIWDARTGGTQITDLLDVDSAAVTVVTSDAAGLVVFYGPDGGTGTLWLDSGVGSRLAVHPTDPEPVAVTGTRDDAESALANLLTALARRRADRRPDHRNDPVRMR